MITDRLDESKIYKISFRKGLTWNPMSLLGVLIRFFAKIKYNHTAILFYLNGGWLLQEAIEEGVKTTLFEKSHAIKYYSHFIIEEPDFEYNYKFSLQRTSIIEGKKYDFKGLLFYQLFLNLFGKWYGKAKDGDKRYYCYESVAYVYGIVDAYKLKPKELNEMFIIIIADTKI